MLSIIYLLNVIINAHSFVQSQIKTESQRRSDVLQSEKKYSEKDYFIVRIRFEKEYKRKHSLREINLLEKHCHWDVNVFYLKSKVILKDKGNIPKVSFPFKFFICFNDRGGGA